MLSRMRYHVSTYHTDRDVAPELIIRDDQIVAPVQWDIEALVQEALHLDPGGGPRHCLFVPTATPGTVSQWDHSSRLAGHPGVHRTKEFLVRRFWWPNMERDIREFVAACPVCARNELSPPTLRLVSAATHP